MIHYTSGSKPRFSLDENRGTHRQVKRRCPRCGRKSFVAMLDWQTMQPIDAAVLGRCDHAQSCGYSDTDVAAYWKQRPDRYEELTGERHPAVRKPWERGGRHHRREFLDIADRIARQWDEEEGVTPAGGNADASTSEQAPTPSTVQGLTVEAIAEAVANILDRRYTGAQGALSGSDDKPYTRQGETRTGGRYGANTARYVKPSTIPIDEVLHTLGGYEGNRLAVWLRDTFAPVLPAAEVERVLLDYAVGTVQAWGGSPVYWQIDAAGLVRTGKAMAYGADGKRVRVPRPLMSWAHTRHEREAEARGERFMKQQCWYGAHRLKERGATAWLCEGEKGAVIAALALRAVDAELYRQIVPVACGGCGGFNPTPDRLEDPWDGLQAAKGRSVAIFPDSGKQGDWAAKAEALNGYAADVRVSRWCEPGAVPYEVHEGDGFDDVILRCIAEGGDLAALMLAAVGM